MAKHISGCVASVSFADQLTGVQSRKEVHHRAACRWDCTVTQRFGTEDFEVDDAGTDNAQYVESDQRMQVMQFLTTASGKLMEIFTTYSLKYNKK